MKTNETTCTSIFQSGKSTPTADQITKAWIDLINQLERTKEIIAIVR